MDYLTEEQVRSHLSWPSLIPAVEQALRNLSSGRIQQPVRSVLRMPERHGILALMPAVDGDLMGIKLVTIYERNRDLPTHQAIIQLFSAHTGEPLVAMDARLITEMRTAAVSAVAVRALAPPDARILAILGSGVQARSHLQALRSVRMFDEVRVWSRTPAHARSFAQEFGALDRETAEAAVRGADIVISVANVCDPLVRGAWLGQDTMVCAVATVGPDRRELDDAAMQGSVIVESRQAAMLESGDIIASRAPIAAEIGEILAGLAPPPPRGRVVFKSLGVGATDLAAAALVLRGGQRSACEDCP